MDIWKKPFLEKISSINALLVALLAVYLGYLLFPFLFSSFLFVAQLLTPFFLAYILYYLLRPIVRLFNKKINIYFSIIIAYCLLAAALAIIVVFIYPTIAKQIVLLRLELMNNLTEWKKEEDLISRLQFQFPVELREAFRFNVTSIKNQIIESFVSFISTFTEFFLALVISIFILFYLLKDDTKIYQKLIKSLPNRYSDYAKDLLTDVDNALMHFITGRVIISAIVSALLFFSFLIIGLDYSFVLAVVAFIFYIIPTIGSFLSMILPLFFAFTTSLFMGIEVLLIMIVAAGLEGFWITPQVMGRELYVHPLTIIFILLVGGSLFGLFGLLFSTPIYILLKIIYTHIYLFIRKEIITNDS